MENVSAFTRWFVAVQKDPHRFVAPIMDAIPLMSILPTSANPEPEEIIDLLAYDPIGTMIMRWKWWHLCDQISTTVVDTAKQAQWKTYLERTTSGVYPKNY